MTQSTTHGRVQDVLSLENISKARCPRGGEYGAVAATWSTRSGRT